MTILNIEFKAKSSDVAMAEKTLLQHNPVFIGEDHQIDTYRVVLFENCELPYTPISGNQI